MARRTKKPKPAPGNPATLPRPAEPPDPSTEAEWRTRKRRIDPKLTDAGWVFPPKGATPLHEPHRTEEEETENGPADYALWADHKVLAVVEAKKVRVGAQEVLGLAPFRRTPELSRCAAIPVPVLVVNGAHHVDG